MSSQPISPPRSLGESLRHLGPGIVLASAIVGSGELIATTTVGAEAGFALLWLVVIGCAIKVPAQVEIGRHTLTWGRTPLEAFDAVPGPRLAGRGWITWCWLAMTVLVVVQQGGILGGVAQTLAAGLPLTAAGRTWNRLHDDVAATRLAAAEARRGADGAGADALTSRLGALEAAAGRLAAPPDTAIWAVVVAIGTAFVLALGRYRALERVAILFVAVFTAVTLAALVGLQARPAWAISARELADGLVPGVPAATVGRGPLATALATFGIIGVGAAELMFYPYWCLEKGYGRAVGPRDDSSGWAERARGWINVMRLDAWVSLAVYTTVTVAFYLLGAATLGRLGLRPAGGEMVRSLGAMYIPVFGAWARPLFLAGAFAVLGSTLVAAADGNARLVTDGLILGGAIPGTPAARAAWTRRIAVGWVFVALVLALAIGEPVGMVLASGVAQSVMLAALAVAVLHFRHRGVDPRLRPSRAWDAAVWVSCAGFLAVAGWTVWQRLLTAAWPTT